MGDEIEGVNMGLTLLQALNAGKECVGDSVVTALTAGDLQELQIIEEINDAIIELRAETDYAWTYKRTTLKTVADVTTENVALTNASATATSVDSDGASATNWTTGVSAGMYLRNHVDRTSYLLSTVDAVSDPNTVTLETTYEGTTATAASYRIFQDTYPIATSDLDKIQALTYGDALNWQSYLGGRVPRSEVGLVSFEDLMYASGGDLHRDTSGRPRLCARIGNDASEQPQIILWPFPSEVFVMQLWYTIRYSGLSAITDEIFSQAAPDIAYTAVRARARYRAFRYNEMGRDAAEEYQRFTYCLALLKKRENDLSQDNSMKVATFRRSAAMSGFPVRSGQYFDTKSSFDR
jgi:hypothetical protein